MTVPDDVLLRSRVVVPDHVVHRAFDGETVALNLDTGQYHGLNGTATRMLELLQTTGSVEATVATVAEEYDVAVERVQVDVLTLCRALAERGIVEIDDRDRDGGT